MKYSQITQNNDVHHLHKEGFVNLYADFDEFLTENNLTFNDALGYFKIYSSITVKSTDIIQTAEKFYGNEWFSDVVVSSKETNWYKKVVYQYNILWLITNKLYNVINLP